MSSERKYKYLLSAEETEMMVDAYILKECFDDHSLYNEWVKVRRG